MPKRKGRGRLPDDVLSQWAPDCYGKRAPKPRAFTDWGAYPLVYVCADGGELCADCVPKSIKHAWSPVVGVQVHYEGPASVCDNCAHVTDSAYGDPENDGDEKA